MPAGDGTGPQGMGPMTGRAAGYCAGYTAPGFANPVPGFGRGMGRGFGRGVGFGRGRGFGRRFGYAAYAQYAQAPVPARFVPVQPAQYAPAAPVQAYPQPQYRKEDEIADLKAEKELIERDLKAIGERIKELEKKQ